MPDVTPVVPGRSAQAKADAAKRRAEDAADASMLRDRVIAAFGTQYLVGDEVGRGGMAVVYAAEDVRLQRKVALKVLPPDLAFRSDVRERFVREAQTAARLNHPNIVPIYAVHEQSGVVCFAMSLITGESVAAWVSRESRPQLEAIASVLEQVADALAYAHASGVVHRDIKPDNILLDRESGRAMVTDFGIARAAETGTRLTQTGIAVGTPAFMSPEQATGEKDVDGRSDVYSLGVVGYLMLTGRLPFLASSTPAMLLAHVSEPPTAIWSIRPDAPRVLVDILERCLAKRPADRWESAQALRDALRRAQRDGSLQASPSREAPSSSPSVAPRTASDPRERESLRASERDRSERARRDYAERHGHRAEDWNPRLLHTPQPAAARQPADWQANAQPLVPLAAYPSMPLPPPLPPLSPTASREEYREWRRAVKDQRKEVQERWKVERQAGKNAIVRAAEATRLLMPLGEQVERFRWHFVSNVALMGMLGFINAASDVGFPWAIFPAFGMSMGLRSRWRELRRQGLRWSQVFRGGDEIDGRARDSRAVASASATDPSHESKSKRIAVAIGAFRKHVKWLAGASAVSFGSLVIGASLNAEPMLVPCIGGLLVALASLQLSTVSGLRLRRLGVPLLPALSRAWQGLLAVPDDRPREVRMREELDRIAAATVLTSSYGETLRSAVDDRLTIGEASARLTDADKAMVPDVEPTADALLERIGSLATGLERLERDLPTGALAQLEARIAAVTAEPAHTPDHDRRLSLLTRQRDSLAELVSRRDTMQRQLESATLAMRSLRFDMVKLRTMGIGAAIGDVTNATQEARALSRDIGHAVDAADEMRRL